MRTIGHFGERIRGVLACGCAIYVLERAGGLQTRTRVRIIDVSRRFIRIGVLSGDFGQEWSVRTWFVHLRGHHHGNGGRRRCRYIKVTIVALIACKHAIGKIHTKISSEFTF